MTIIRAGGLGVVAALTSPVSVSNSTSDTAILAYTLAALSPVVGTRLVGRAIGTSDCQESGTPATLEIWLKTQAGTKVVAIAINTSTIAEQDLKPWNVEFVVTFQAVGASGSFVLAARLETNMPQDGIVNRDVVEDAIAIDTTTANTFTIGMTWSTAAAGNVGRAQQAAWIRDAA